MNKTIPLLMILAVALAGCATKTTFVPDGPPLVTKAPADVMVTCDPVPDPPAHGANMGALLEFSDSMIGLYGECAAHDADKAGWIKSQGH